ncbi:MAG: hypothetical protein ACJ0GY_04040 [Synechococcus sp.]|nr:hypothetical protein [Synechococcus sp.]QNJ31927.1 hypothetical protein SynPROS91_01553 [Synechococcus sp. PROS-9-1]RCL56331.1 MAG: hypothetical protein DBW82_10400 [Synechococcus sp. MED-G68]
MTEWHILIEYGKAISSQDLAPHTPEEGGFAFFFYAMALHQGDPLCDLSINDWLDAMAQGLFISLKTMVVA